MKKETIIKRYVKKNALPDQTLCPAILIYWVGQNKGAYYTKVWNSATNEIHQLEGKYDCYSIRRHTNVPHGYIRCASSNYYHVYYAKCCGNDIIEIAEVMLDIHRNSDCTQRNWEYKKRMFLFKDDPNAYDANGNVVFPYGMGKFYNTMLYKYLYHDLSKLGRNENFCNEVLKFFNNVSPSYKYSSTYYPWVFAKEYTRMWHKPSEKSEKMTTIFEKLYAGEQYSKPCIAFQAIDGNGIFRYFRGTQGTSEDEKVRIVVNDKDVAIFQNCGGKWVRTPSKIDNLLYCYGDTRLNLYLDGMKEITKIKYISDIIDEFDDTNKLKMIVNLLRHPIVEKMWKSGYHKLALGLCEDGKITANLKSIYNAKEKSGKLYEIIGFNKYQLRKLENEYQNRYTHGFAKAVKDLAQVERVSDLSNDKTDFYFDQLNNLVRNTGGYACIRYYYIYDVNEYGHPVRFWRYRNREMTAEDIRKINNIMKLGAKNTNAYRLFSDSVSTYCRLNAENRPDIELYEVKSFEELVRVHDNLTELLNQQSAAMRGHWGYTYSYRESQEELKKKEEAMKKINEERIEKYEKIGEDFSILVPRKLSEITEEGIKLSHCVGGYIDRVARGMTNILFLRKNSEKDSPFYTIEVRDGNVIQIHGKYNRWLGNNPEAIKFVVDWLKEKGIKFVRDMVLSTATGYCNNGRLLDGAAYGL